MLRFKIENVTGIQVKQHEYIDQSDPSYKGNRFCLRMAYTDLEM